MALPPVKIEIAFASQPDDPAPVWTDVTQWVDLTAGITIGRGRLDEFSTVQPGTAAFTLDNADGRFTAGRASSPYYPNIKIRKKVRISHTVAGTTYYGFTGYIEEWPVEWPGGGAYSAAQITAVDRFKRLGTLSAFRSVIEEEYLSDDPFAYFTLADAAGATQAGDTSGNGRSTLTSAQLGSGGTLTFGTATGPPTDGLTALQLAPASTTAGKYLSGPLNVTSAAYAAGHTIECFFNTSTANLAGILTIGNAGSMIMIMQLGIDSSGHLTGLSAWGSAVASTVSVVDGLTHHAALVESLSVGATAAAVTQTLYLDGSVVGSVTVGGLSVSTYLYQFATVAIGGPALSQTQLGGGTFNGTLSHAACYDAPLSAARIADHAAAGSTGFAGERSDQRISRYARWAGVPVAEQSLEVGLSTSIAFVDTTGTAPVQAMQDVTATESGVLQIDGQGRLAFQSRGHRYNPASVLTLAGVIDPSAKFIENDVYLRNDITANRAGGVSYRAVNAASVLDFGTAADSLTLLTTSDNEVVDAANWKANQNAAPSPRLPSLIVDILSRPTLQAGVLALDVSSRVTVTQLPAQAPAPALDLFIEGWTETISDQAWTFAFNASPAAASGVWQLDSPMYSQLGVSTRLAY